MYVFLRVPEVWRGGGFVGLSVRPSIHLSNRDVQVNDTVTPEFLEVHIKASKTDQGLGVFGQIRGRCLPSCSDLGVHGSLQGATRSLFHFR